MLIIYATIVVEIINIGFVMQRVRILDSKFEIEDRLMELGLTEEALIRIVSKAVAAYNSSVHMDPVSAARINAYNMGTRAIRQELLPKGWKLDRTDNVESTINPVTNIKLMYQNVDSAADRDREPKAISKKGSAINKMVMHSQLDFCDLWGAEFQPPQVSEVWFLCVYINDGVIQAELSCPSNIIRKQFNGFIERIFLVKAGDWNNIKIDGKHYFHSKDDILLEEDIEITISRK